MTTYNHTELPELDDVALDQMLAEWAEAEVEIPDDFHNNLMQRLQTMQTAPQPQKNNIVSLSKKLFRQKRWISAVVAATVMVCCIPVLQTGQEKLVSSENGPMQMYEMKNRSIDSIDTEYMMDLAPNDALILANDNLAEMKAHLTTLGDSVEYEAQRRELEEKIAQLQDEIMALEAQLNE